MMASHVDEPAHSFTNSAPYASTTSAPIPLTSRSAWPDFGLAATATSARLVSIRNAGTLRLSRFVEPPAAQLLDQRRARPKGAATYARLQNGGRVRWCQRKVVTVNRQELAAEVAERVRRLKQRVTRGGYAGPFERLAIEAALTNRGLLGQRKGG